ncbi:hypothetical protein NX784_07375 [Massilia pinisoli]|uniref:DUF5028 domain-containing protein n=1 Tax=Massilia pinisoli TaxID=1772194 RepID=A0ABT1ZNB9_9BURK|nr:hypothetical protein [Massilia pinisoli]MCS0581408.1 hypothetical protein [Massilia pinisoli]
MKKASIMLASAILCPMLGRSQTVYDGYEKYYATQNHIFTSTSRIQVSGTLNTIILWHEKRVDLARAKGFPGEFTENDDLGSDAKAYEDFPFACVEGQSASSSGTAVRHMSVYLMQMRQNRQVITYKLPSLFASCLGVRLDAFKRPLFDDADYIYPSGSDIPTGVRLEEYMIDKDKFVPTGHSVALDFVEPDNVWKFRVHTVQ